MNKKIKNAKVTEYNGINFKSKTEVMVYKTLINNGFEVFYEPTSYVVWKGYKPKKSFYRPDKEGILKLDDVKVRDITYTPDFITSYKDLPIIIEVKGFSNDVYPYKRKLFRKYLEDLDQNSMYFEIHTKRQLLQAIEIIKNYDSNRNNETNV